jgi:hypothetical protein
MFEYWPFALFFSIKTLKMIFQQNWKEFRKDRKDKTVPIKY